MWRELAAGRRTLVVVAIEPVAHLFTVEEYEAMGRADVLPPGKRLELLRGEIVEMTPIGSPHASVVNRLNRLLISGLGDRAIVAVQMIQSLFVYDLRLSSGRPK